MLTPQPRPSRPDFRRPDGLEHVGGAVVSGSARDLPLGADQRESLGDLEHLRPVSSECAEFQRPHGTQEQRGCHADGMVDRLSESYYDRCTRGGPPLRRSRGFYPWGGFNTDSRKKISGGFWVNLWNTDEGKTKGSSLDPSIRIRPASQFQVAVSAGFQKGRRPHAVVREHLPDQGGVLVQPVTREAGSRQALFGCLVQRQRCQTSDIRFRGRTAG